MVKAHSLLYAIYICLLVSIICGALLYIATLFTQLNQHYNLLEGLYINNQSVVNFALGNKMVPEEIPPDESGTVGSYTSTPYGLLTLLLAQSATRNDTVASAHFVGGYAPNNTALHLANFTRPLAFSGTLTLIGDSQLPSIFIEKSYFSNKTNKLTVKGKLTVSEIALPEINPAFKKIFEGIPAQQTNLSEFEKPVDSVFYNSFFNPAKEIYVSNPGKAVYKGNMVLRSKDSIFVSSNTVLEDVILMAPKIMFEEGFKGSVQAFATNTITTGDNVSLGYPSVLCVYNNNKSVSGIQIGKNCRMSGAVVLFGNDISSLSDNNIEIEEGGLITGDIYCTGRLMLKSNVNGAVYSNQVYYLATKTIYENLLSDVVIDASARPAHFIAIPIFDSKKTVYGLIKKVL